MPPFRSCLTRMRIRSSWPPTRESKMRSAISRLAMVSAFVSLAAFMVQEVDARGGRGGGGGGRGGRGGGGVSRGGSSSMSRGGGGGFSRGGSSMSRGGMSSSRGSYGRGSGG